MTMQVLRLCCEKIRNDEMIGTIRLGIGYPVYLPDRSERTPRKVYTLSVGYLKLSPNIGYWLGELGVRMSLQTRMLGATHSSHSCQRVQ